MISPSSDTGPTWPNGRLFLLSADRRNAALPEPWLCRIGINTGPVIGSIVGIHKYVYDIFGPAVNLAARMEEVSEPRQITVCRHLRAAEGRLHADRPRRVRDQGLRHQAALLPGGGEQGRRDRRRRHQDARLGPHRHRRRLLRPRHLSATVPQSRLRRNRRRLRRSACRIVSGCR